MTPIVCSRPLVQLGRDVAAAAADREHDDLELALLHRGVGDLEAGLRISRSAGASMSPAVTTPAALLRDMHLDLGRLAVQPADEVLEVEDDIRNVLADARERGELVRDALDLDGRDGGALERREQDAAQRVAERVAEAAVERLDPRTRRGSRPPPRGRSSDLELHEAGSDCHVAFRVEQLPR